MCNSMCNSSSAVCTSWESSDDGPSVRHWSLRRMREFACEHKTNDDDVNNKGGGVKTELIIGSNECHYYISTLQVEAMVRIMVRIVWAPFQSWRPSLRVSQASAPGQLLSLRTQLTECNNHHNHQQQYPAVQAVARRH